MVLKVPARYRTGEQRGRLGKASEGGPPGSGYGLVDWWTGGAGGGGLPWWKVAGGLAGAEIRPRPARSSSLCRIGGSCGALEAMLGE